MDAGSMADAVETAITAGEFGAPDRAVVALMRRYAYELDEAAALEASYEQLRGAPGWDQADYRRLDAIERRVRAATAVAEIGPKLLAAAEALGLSPQARARLKIPPPAAPVSPQQAALAGLRDELADRRAAH